MKHESIKLVTFRTDGGMEEILWYTGDEEEERPRTLSSKRLGLGEEQGLYRRVPLVPVGDRNWD